MKDGESCIGGIFRSAWLFLQTLVFIFPSGFLIVLVSRNAIDLSFSSTVNKMCWLMELRWEWNSARCLRVTQTWLSSTYLHHHLGGWGAVFKALSSMYSVTKFAKIALTGRLDFRRSLVSGLPSSRREVRGRSAGSFPG